MLSEIEVIFDEVCKLTLCVQNFKLNGVLSKLYRFCVEGRLFSDYFCDRLLYRNWVHTWRCQVLHLNSLQNIIMHK